MQRALWTSLWKAASFVGEIRSYHHFIIRASTINNRKNATAIIITIAIKTILRILPVYIPTVCNTIISELPLVEAHFDVRVNLQYLLVAGWNLTCPFVWE